MPQIGWLVDGEYWLHQDYMEYVSLYPKDCPWTPEMLDLMFQHQERDFMSPTTIKGCPRMAVLKRATGYIPELQANHEGYYVEPQKAWAAARGTIAHLLFENGRNEADSIIEKRYSLTLNIDGEALTISGKPDKLVPEGDGTWLIIDYKTVEDEKLEKLYGRPKGDWTVQLSSYRYLLHHNGIEVSRARLQMVSMKAPKAIDLTDKLWDLDRTERWLVGRARKFKGVYNGEFSLENLPPMLDFTLDDNAWLCKEFIDKETGKSKGSWCPVRDLCYALNSVGK